jgi:cytochrome P450
MLARTDLPPIDVRGPKAPPLIGPIGNVLRFFADPVRSMFELHRDHGDLAAVADRNAAIVCAFGSAHNQTVVTRAATFEHLSEVPIRVRPGTSFARLNNTVILKNGEAHRTRRRLLMPAFTKSAVEGYAREIVTVADAMVSRWPIGSTTNVAPLLRDLTAAIVLRCLFGLPSVDGIDELGQLSIATLSTIASPLAMLLPYDIPGTPYARGLRFSERLEKRIRALIAERRRDPAGKDALSLLIHARDEQGAVLSDDDLLGESNTLFSAGFDTSAHTLTWTLFLLALHPDVLDDLVDELDTVLRGDKPTAEHVPALVKLDRVIKESMRLLPVAVLLFMRVCASEARLGAHTLPQGTSLFLSPIITHRDPTLYPDPQRFNPARWETVEPSIFEYLPFGAGARMCIGASFATLALRLTLARILQSVRPVLPAKVRVDYELRGPSMGPKHGLRLQLRPATQRAREPVARVSGSIRSLIDLPG